MLDVNILFIVFLLCIFKFLLKFFFSYCFYLYLELLCLFFFYIGNVYFKYEYDVYVIYIFEVFFCILILNMYEDILRIIFIIEI